MYNYNKYDGFIVINLVMTIFFILYKYNKYNG